VDIWWSTEKSGNFMILLGYLITHSKQWLENGATIRIFNVVKDIEEEIKKQERTGTYNIGIQDRKCRYRDYNQQKQEYS